MSTGYPSWGGLRGRDSEIVDARDWIEAAARALGF